METERLVFKSGLQALRCCLELETKLARAKQPVWSDYEFGPTEQDEFGNDSIEVPLPTREVNWARCSHLGMGEFYAKGCSKETSYSVGSSCPSDVLAKTIWWLLKEH